MATTENGQEEDYSKEASTVEVLDNRLVIIPPSRWLLLFSLLAVVLFLIVWGVVGELTTRVEGWGIISSTGSQLLSIDAPRHGIVKRVLVKEGALVQEGEELLEMVTVSGLPTQHFQLRRVQAPMAAKVVSIATEGGRHVEKRQVLMRLQAPGKSPLGLIYLPPQAWQQVRVGQRALLHAFGIQALEGKIISVDSTPQSRQQIISRWGDGIMLPRGKLFYQVTCALDQPLAVYHKSHGYSWLLANKTQLAVGTQKRFSITVRKYSPLSLVLPWLGGIKQ